MKFYTLLLCFGYLHFIRTKNTTKETISSRCANVKKIYTDAGYQAEDIYDKETDAQLKVCSSSLNCCSPRAESNLYQVSEAHRQQSTPPQKEKIKELFEDSSPKFKEIFRNLLRRSEERLDDMFRDTYKKRYVENIGVFKALYVAFNQYVNGSELLIKEKVDSFFAEVHKIVYLMTKPFDEFDTEYKNCIEESTSLVKPFGDMQRKIAFQTSRPFLATRVFLQGLKVGMEVISDIFRMSAPNQCSVAFLRMTQCTICSGVTHQQPCHSYCNNVMKGCFAHIVMLQQKWDDYITKMIALAVKLEGPFNFEAAVEPLRVKISDAIMTFQDNQSNVTLKVEAKCGKPTSSINNLRRRRSAEETKSTKSDDAGEFKTWVNKISKSQNIFKKFKQETQFFINNGYKADSSLTHHIYSKRKNASAFETLLSKTKSNLESLRYYWIELSSNFCKNGLSSAVDVNCWNGANTSGYSLPIVGDNVHDLFNRNPEMKFAFQKPDKFVVIQADKLSSIIKKLKGAESGEERTDTEESSGQGSGDESSGESNNGSGDGEVVLPPDEGSASGSGIEVVHTTKKTTVTRDKCANSVDKNCLDKSKTTTARSPNDVANLPVINPLDSEQTGDTGSSSKNILANIILLWLTSLIAIFLL